MFGRQLTYRKDKRKNWLLPVILLLSFFTFSGLQNYAGSRPSVAKTEWVVSVYASPGKGVSLKRAIALGTKRVPFAPQASIAWNPYVLLLFRHHQLTISRAAHLRDKRLHIIAFSQLFQVKTIPLSSPESLPAILHV